MFTTDKLTHRVQCILAESQWHSQRALVPWNFRSNLHVCGLKDAAKYNSGFLWFCVGHGDVLGHQWALGSFCTRQMSSKRDAGWLNSQNGNPSVLLLSSRRCWTGCGGDGCESWSWWHRRRRWALRGLSPPSHILSNWTSCKPKPSCMLMSYFVFKSTFAKD